MIYSHIAYSIENEVSGANIELEKIIGELDSNYEQVVQNKSNDLVTPFRNKILDLLDQQSNARRNAEKKLMALCEEKATKVR